MPRPMDSKQSPLNEMHWSAFCTHGLTPVDRKTQGLTEKVPRVCGPVQFKVNSTLSICVRPTLKSTLERFSEQRELLPTVDFRCWQVNDQLPSPVFLGGCGVSVKGAVVRWLRQGMAVS